MGTKELKRLVMAMAERIAEQSNSLSTIAERNRPNPDPRPLLIGEASNTERSEPFRGLSGRFFADMININLDRLHELFECVNIVPWWPGQLPGEKGDQFRSVVARLRAKSLNVINRRLILVGERVAAAFNIKDTPWMEPVSLGRGESSTIVVPCPLAIVRSWNDPTIKDRASAILSRLARSLG